MKDFPPQSRLSTSWLFLIEVALILSLLRPMVAEDGRPSPIWSLEFSPDGKTLAVGTYQIVLLFETSDWHVRDTLEGLLGGVQALAFSADGKLLAAAGGLPKEIGMAVVWKLENLEHVADIDDHLDVIEAIAMDPTGKVLVSVSSDERVMVNRLEDGELLATLGERLRRIYSVAFSPEGTFFVTGGSDQTATIWDAGTYEPVLKLGHAGGPIHDVLFAPKEKLFASCGGDGRIRTWALASNGHSASGRLIRVLRAHQGPVYSAAFLPGGQRMVSGGSDGQVILWEISTGLVQRKWESSNEPIHAVAVDPEGRWVCAGGRDGKLRLWNLETGALVFEQISTFPRVEDTRQGEGTGAALPPSEN